MTQPQSLKSLLARPAAPTLGAQLRGAVARALILAGALAASAGLIYSIPGVDFGVGRLNYSPAVPAEASTRGDLLVERHGCWTGEAPADVAGEIPGGVVMALPGKAPRYYADDARVGQALDQVFGGGVREVRVFGFCR